MFHYYHYSGWICHAGNFLLGLFHCVCVRKKSLTLALRLNENLIIGSIQNQRRLTIRSGGRNVTMQFSLFVLAPKKP